MCLVIDTCCLAKVFDQSNSDHRRFAPVLNWITKGQGSIVYGGSKYTTELKRASKFIPILAELNRRGRVIRLPNKKVNAIAKQVKEFVNSGNFNDEHLIAIVRVARCVIVCTDDKAAEPYLKRRDLYPKGAKKPRIYKHEHHKSLCCSGNIVGVCKGQSV